MTEGILKANGLKWEKPEVEEDLFKALHDSVRSVMTAARGKNIEASAQSALLAFSQFASSVEKLVKHQTSEIENLKNKVSDLEGFKPHLK